MCQERACRWNRAENTKKKKAITKQHNQSCRKTFQIKRKSRTELLDTLRNIFSKGEEKYYKPVRVGNFYINNYMEEESNGERNKIPNEIKPT